MELIYDKGNMTLRKFCVHEEMGKLPKTMQNVRAYKELKTAWVSVKYLGFVFTSVQSIRYRFDITDSEVVDRMKQCDTFDEVLSGVELKPNSVYDIYYRNINDLVSGLKMSTEEYIRLTNKGLSAWDIYRNINNVSKLCLSPEPVRKGRDYYACMEPAYVIAATTTKVFVKLDKRKGQKYFDYATVTVPLCGISCLTYEEKKELVGRCMKEYARTAKRDLLNHKVFLDNGLPTEFLVCNNATLTRSDEIVFKFGWAGDNAGYVE